MVKSSTEEDPFGRCDAPAADHARRLADQDRERRRFGLVLAQLVNLERLEALRRPRRGLGRVIGGLIDLPLYGLLGLLGVRRADYRARAVVALRDDLPWLYDLIQRARRRPAYSHRDGAFEVVRLPGGTDGGVPTLELRNLFAGPRTREAVRDACLRLLDATTASGPVSHLVALNFHAGGGAETAALAYAEAAVADTGHALVLLTDPGPRRAMPSLPERVTVLDFRGLGAQLDADERRSLLYLLLQTVGPQVLHIVNSEAAWRLLLAAPRAMLPVGRIVASVFAMQRDAASGEPVGYTALLARAADRLDRLVTDNRAFADLAAEDLAVDPGRIRVVSNPSRLEGAVSIEEARRRLRARTASSSARPAVVWAGRLDMEKRIDLLHEIARRMGDRVDFEVFGTEVLGGAGWTRRLSSLPNVRLRGAYASPLEWDEPATRAFLFTSVSEGMPNTLVEAGWLGLPTVASAVGGVTDLIDDTTGWPVPADAGVDAYVVALDRVLADPALAEERTANLIDRVFARHATDGFRRALAEAYGAG